MRLCIKTGHSKHKLFTGKLFWNSSNFYPFFRFIMVLPNDRNSDQYRQSGWVSFSIFTMDQVESVNHFDFHLTKILIPGELMAIYCLFLFLFCSVLFWSPKFFAKFFLKPIHIKVSPGHFTILLFYYCLVAYALPFELLDYQIHWVLLILLHTVKSRVLTRFV